MPSKNTAPARLTILPSTGGLCLEYFEHTVSTAGLSQGHSRTVISMPAIIQEHEVPAHISEAGAMDRPDYVDLFTVVAAHARVWSPEAGARTALDGAGAGCSILWSSGTASTHDA